MKNNLFIAEARGQMSWINPPENTVYTEEGGLMIAAPPSAEDGEDWRLIRYFGMKCPSGIVAGVVAQSPKGDGCQVHFDYLLLSQPEAVSRF